MDRLGNSSAFKAFLAALALRLGKPVGHCCAAHGIWLLSAEHLPFQIVFYTLHPYRSRIKSTPGMRSIHIDEDQWLLQPELLLNRLAALAGYAQRVYARDTVAARIDKQAATAFLEDHHLQVALSGKFRFGLFHNGEMVAAAVFSGGRRMRDKPEDYRSFELLRFCHKQGVHVVGGFSKLINAFRHVFNPGDIMTYADKDWTDGNSYQQVGFIKAGETAPQLFWIDHHTFVRYHDRTLPAIVKDEAAAQRLDAGFIPVYNSGSIKMVRSFDVPKAAF